LNVRKKETYLKNGGTPLCCAAHVIPDLPEAGVFGKKKNRDCNTDNRTAEERIYRNFLTQAGNALYLRTLLSRIISW
jgi:hypothetical protein